MNCGKNERLGRFFEALEKGMMDQSHLRQVVEANRRYHHENCRAGSARAPWDYLALTAANRRQAEIYALQLAERKARGFFHQDTVIIVAVDEKERRIGSGGATLNALRAVESHSRQAGAGPISRRRILVIHCGGSAVRIPHLAALGKVFATVGARLPDGTTSTVFDELYISFCSLGMRMKEGVAVLSGDVLLAFPTEQMEAEWRGVRGVAFLAPVEVGVQHGVYITAPDGRVTGFLQKAAAAELERMACATEAGRVAVDSGVFLFDRASTKKLLKLAGAREKGGSLFQWAMDNGKELDLYDHFARAFAKEPGGEDRSATELREAFCDVPFSAKVFDSFAFVHMGTTRQYLDALTGRDEAARVFGAGSTNSFISSEIEYDAVAHNACIEGAGRACAGAVVEDCILNARLQIAPDSLLAGLSYEGPALNVPSGVVIRQMPLRDSGGAGSWATLIFGVQDNPKLSACEGGTFLGAPLDALAARLRVAEELIWSAQAAHSLWHARLFPRGPCPELDTAWHLLEPAAETRSKWIEAQRVSLAEVFEAADPAAALRFQQQAFAEAAAANLAFHAARFDDFPSSDIIDGRTKPAAVLHFARAVEKRLQGAAPLIRSRLLAAAASAARHCLRAPKVRLWIYDDAGLKAEEISTQTPEPSSHEALETAAFHEVEVLLRRAKPELKAPEKLRPLDYIKGVTPARLDFGGGWSDTPPYCLEKGGAVFNCAIDLDGGPPVEVEVARLSEPLLRLISRDQNRALEVANKEHLMNYTNPADPFSLVKASVALVFPDHNGRDAGLFESLGGGLQITTSCRIPLGSGLGTSSIVAATLIASLARLRGFELSRDDLFDLVLTAEQMITTGGGWQDQVGGIVGGLKLSSTRPGVPQRLLVEPLELAPGIRAELEERLILFYTGQTRRTKNLLREIMASYLRREPGTVEVLARIKGLAAEMRDALGEGDVDRFGLLMGQHWELNKRMDPHSTTAHIDELFRAGAPYMAGGKPAGAGGGGFLMAVARSPGDAKKLAAAFTKLSTGKAGRSVAWNINLQGFQARF